MFYQNTSWQPPRPRWRQQREPKQLAWRSAWAIVQSAAGVMCMLYMLLWPGAQLMLSSALLAVMLAPTMFA
jgi:asparagine N-glycosylation enzyme membrane subunit Stt3